MDQETIPLICKCRFSWKGQAAELVSGVVSHLSNPRQTCRQVDVVPPRPWLSRGASALYFDKAAAGEIHFGDSLGKAVPCQWVWKRGGARNPARSPS